MTPELSELYQEVILDHNRYPRNFHGMPQATAEAEGYNPICGDLVKVYILVNDNRIQQASFEGSGCAISQASASMMTELLMGKTLQEAERLYQYFHELVTVEPTCHPEQTECSPHQRGGIDKLSVLAGVRHYPARVKCATLAWHALEAAIHHSAQSVTTEE